MTYQAGSAMLTRHVCAVVGDGFTVVAGKSRQTMARVAALAAVATCRAITTWLVVGTEVQI